MEANKPSRWRIGVLMAGLAGVLLALAGRVVYLQYVLGPGLQGMIDRQQRRMIVLPARDGNIFATSRGGPVLVAGSRQVASCFADPVLIGEENLEDVAAKVAPALGALPADVYGKLYTRRYSRFVWLKQEISDETAAAVDGLRVPGVETTYEWRRTYPYGPCAAQVIGFRQKDGQAGTGMELGADHWLKARPGHQWLRADAGRKGAYAQVEECVPPVEGQSVLLTIDVVIQGYLEKAMAAAYVEYEAEGVMGVVMDPETGTVLAIASMPTFDPNDYPSSRPEQWRLRAITDPYEPGSAFKPFIAVGALEMEKVTLDTTFFCHHGTYQAYRGGTIRDFPGEHFGDLPLREIVIHSSNIGMAKLGEFLGNGSLFQIADAFGFGRRTGIALPGEDPGRLVPIRNWTSYSTRRMPFGQGPIVVTTLQLATGFSAIANGGMLMKPRLVDRVIGADGQVVFENPPQRVRRVLSETTSRRFIDEVLVNVVERGTGKQARLDRWKVFGKTGTAQVGSARGYIDQAYTATFIGGAPADRPAVVCAVSVFRPKYSKGHTGGRVAAPVVRDVLCKTLGYMEVPPDKFETVVSAPGATDDPLMLTADAATWAVE